MNQTVNKSSTRRADDFGIDEARTLLKQCSELSLNGIKPRSEEIKNFENAFILLNRSSVDADKLLCRSYKKSKLPIYTLLNILEKEYELTWLVDGVIQSGRLYQFFGPQKSGKSQIALNLALALCHGEYWAELRTTKSIVYYVAGEAESDIQARIHGYRTVDEKISRDAPFILRHKPVYITNRDYSISLRNEIKLFQEELPGIPIVIIIDTLARNFGAGSENSDEDMGAFCNNLRDEVIEKTGCAVIVVHHSGHGGQSRSRGHSILPASVDATYQIKKDSDNDARVILSIIESRNTSGNNVLTWEIREVLLPRKDNFGGLVRVPVLEFVSN